MRTMILTFAMAMGLLAVPANGSHRFGLPGAAIAEAAAPALQNAEPQQTVPQPPPINVQVNHGGRAWYASPVWVAIGVIAFVLVILLIVMAARGGGSTGGTTIVRG